MYLVVVRENGKSLIEAAYSNRDEAQICSDDQYRFSFVVWYPRWNDGQSKSFVQRRNEVEKDLNA